jgi:hypothetical protein
MRFVVLWHPPIFTSRKSEAVAKSTKGAASLLFRRSECRVTAGVTEFLDTTPTAWDGVAQKCAANFLDSHESDAHTSIL